MSDAGAVTAMGCENCRLIAFDASGLAAVVRPDASRPPVSPRSDRPVHPGTAPSGLFHANFRTQPDAGDHLIAGVLETLFALPVILLGLLD